MIKKYLFVILAAVVAVGCNVDEDSHDSSVITVVEQFEAPMAADETYLYGYRSDNLEFQHFVDAEYGYWGGFAQAASYDMADGTYLNQYSVYNTAAASGDSYMLYYYDSYNAPCDILCNYDAEYAFTSVRLNLTTYTYKSITEEDVNIYARAFTDGDYLKVTFTALYEDMTAGASVDCYVVDYRDGKRYAATNWDLFDLSALHGNIHALRVTIDTTDVGEWGANTPLYVCLDDLTYTYKMKTM